jgi:GxxExxY protein
MTELLYKKLTYSVIGAAMEVHRELGSGFLEAVYQKALAHELLVRKIFFEEHVHLPITYKGELIGDYIADYVVDGKLIVEIKAVSRLSSAHQAQAMHNLTATGLRLALLLNFGAGSVEHRRVIK